MKKGNTFLGGLHRNNEYIGEIYKGSTLLNSFGWDKTATGNFPLTLPDCRSKALTKCKINPYLAQNGITVNGKLYKVADGVTILDTVSSSGASAVDLGIAPVSTDNVSIRRKHKGTAATTCSYFGCMPSASQSTPRFSFGKYNASGAKDFAGFNTTQVIGTVDTSWHTERIYYENSTFYVQRDDGTPTSYSPQVQVECDLTAYLFARHGTSGVQVYDGEGTEIAFVDWKDVNGNQKAYFVGAIKNNVVGVYDLVSGQFIAPTTGTLTAGKTTRTVNIHSEIPYDEYEEVEYIATNDNSPYIRTGVIGKGGTTARVKFKAGSSFDDDILGSWDGTNRIFLLADVCEVLKIGYGQAYDVMTIQEDTVYDYVASVAAGSQTVDVDGMRKYTGAIASDIDTNIEMYLFTRNQRGTARATEKTLFIYLTQIWQNNILVRDFIPVKRLSDNAYGMYDLVSKTFFGNAGAGTFTGGTSYQMEVPICTVERSGDKTENLFDPANKKYNGYTINSGSGTRSPTGNRCINVFGWLDAGDYIICSTTDTLGNYLHKYSEEGTDSTFSGWLGAIVISSTVHSGELYCKTFALTERCFCRGVNSASLANSGNIMLVKGSTAPTAYIPYGWEYDTTITCGTETETVKHYSKMLQGSINLVSGVETEGWGSHTFDGTESFVNEGILDNCWVWSSRLDDDTSFTDRTAYCNEFKHSASLPSSGNREGYVLIGKVVTSSQSMQAGKYVGFGLPSFFDTETKVKAWIAGKTVYYPKKTSTTTQASAHTITASKGTNVIDCGQSKTGEADYISRTV